MPARRRAGCGRAGRLLGVLLALLILPSAARADDLEIGLRRAVPAGEKPALLVTVHKQVRRLVVELKRDDGRKVRIERTRLPVDAPVELPLAQAGGRAAWSGRLAVTFRDGTSGEMPLSFETVVSAGLRVVSHARREDVLARKAEIVADGPVDEVVIEVYGEGGRLLGRTVARPKPVAPGRPIPISWSQDTPGEPIKIAVTAKDADGFTGGLVWMPWQVRIPHEEVVFDTGKAEIRDDQAPRLQGVLVQLRAALEKYGAVVEVRLWIAGHTDTVGGRSYNRDLSERRARAIGRWFRAHGVKAPIFYRGFGEDAPAVPTPDETDEPRNRRAEYLVAGEDPYPGRDLPGAWKPLD